LLFIVQIYSNPALGELISLFQGVNLCNIEEHMFGGSVRKCGKRNKQGIMILPDMGGMTSNIEGFCLGQPFMAHVFGFTTTIYHPTKNHPQMGPQNEQIQ
jgi:hypothetical protein